MDNQTAIGLLSLCGIVTVLILLGSFLLLRIMKSSVFGIANMVLRSVTDPPEVKATTTRTQPTERPDFRSAAHAVDFDAAVASRKGEATPSIHTTPAAPELKASAFSAPEPAAPKPRRRVRHEHNDDDDDGEMFEGLLGE